MSGLNEIKAYNFSQQQDSSLQYLIYPKTFIKHNKQKAGNEKK